MEPCGPDCGIITGMAIDITDDSELEETVYNLIKDIEEARVVYEIFESNKHELESTANSFDKYYHAKSNCESAELGIFFPIPMGFINMDVCVDTGICAEGMTMKNNQGQVVPINKENCINNGYVWYEKDKSCNLRNKK